MTNATRKALLEANKIIHEADWDQQAGTEEKLHEAQFTIPLHRDPEISDGAAHEQSAWDWLQGELCEHFSLFWTQAGTGEAVWKSEKTGRILRDQLKCYVVVLPSNRVDELRSVLKHAATSFNVQRIYLSNAGSVEYVQAD